jgi:hypothetical protein
MAQQVVSGALLQCSFGAAPAPLTVLPVNRVTGCSMPAANIMDHVPMLNIPSFAMCSSPSNPVVIAATAAALGVLTPMPCVPATATPWVPGVPTVKIANMPAVSNECKLNCMWAGIIAVNMAGQFTVTDP